MCMADHVIAQQSVPVVTVGQAAITVQPNPRRIAIIFATDNSSAVLNVYAATSQTPSRLVGGKMASGDLLQIIYHERDWGALVQGPFTVVPAAGTPNIAVWEIISSAELAAATQKAGL